ncbi:hypothetical protein ACOTVP_08805 [Aliarcobacter butzleri]
MNKRQFKKRKQHKIKSVQRLNFTENDTLIFTINERISYDAQLRTYENIKKALKHDKILILTGGLEFNRLAIKDIK